jgi:hypothetical protein
MVKKAREFFSSETRVARVIYGGLMLVIFGFVFGPSVFAQFYRNTQTAGYGYGSGYGYGYGSGPDGGANGYRINGSTPLTAYGYGYGFGAEPVIAFTGNYSQTVTVGSVATFTAYATDTDVTTPGVAIAYNSSNKPAGATINSSTGAFSWDTTGVTPNPYTFTVTAAGNTGGLASQSVTITVNAVSNSGSSSSSGSSSGGGGGSGYALPTASFTTNYSTIILGQSAILTWTTTNATAVSINQGIGTVGTSGTTTVTPTSTTAYILTATGSGGTTTQTVTVTIGSSMVVSTPANPSSGLQLPGAGVAGAHTPGSVILTTDGTVWFITLDNTRRAFTSAGAFLSYGYLSFSQVVDANAVDLTLPQGTFIPPMDGKVVCSDRNDSYAVKGTCYLITNGEKAAFTSAKVFTALGFKFSHTTKGDVSFLTPDANISNVALAHRPGVLVNNKGTVQLVGMNGLMGIPTMDVLGSWGYTLADVVPANAADKAITQSGVMSARITGQLSP